MKTLPDTVFDYSIKAAESFLQTAVFVDDRIYTTKPKATEAPKILSVPRTRKKSSKSAERGDAHASEIDSDARDLEESETSPDTYEIVNHFAKKQIVCSLYQPKEGAKVSKSSDIFPLCKAADIVVIDWDLYGDKGQKAKELADGLIKQAVEDVPEQLRLILVYTQELNLQAIANELFETVQASIGEDFRVVDGEEGLVFHTENSRVVVLGKPGRTRPDQYKRFVVEEKDLADVAVREFARLASGLLHAAALLGLAEIRKNSRKILSKFNKNLDPGFLTHVAMCLPLEDASTHVAPLLVSEIESVLEDVLPNPLISKKLIEDWVDNIWKPGDHLEAVFGKQGVNYREVAKVLCTQGFKEALQNEESLPNPNAPKDTTKKIRKAAQFLLPSSTSDSNHRFSHLMSTRTFYGDKEKALKLGTIVHDRSGDRYFLCIQPICDSVRLKGERVFVFVGLETRSGEPSDKISHIVMRSDESVLELAYRPKSYLCYTTAFKPDTKSLEVTAKEDEQGEPFFENCDGVRFFWLDQLKPPHAQRAVEQFASDLSRVGLTESDWVRRLVEQMD